MRISTRSLLFALLMLAIPVASSPQIILSIGIAPPPLRVYQQPACSSVGYIWTPGYWANAQEGYWVPGTWEMAEPGLLWTPGYWGLGDNVSMPEVAGNNNKELRLTGGSSRTAPSNRETS